jgi:energy-coupling factor transporter transmembrane protein EcfT
MSGIISYVKRIGVWLCIVIACETIMIITMMLNKIPFAEIGYGIFISLFLLLILLAFDAMRYYRHYQKVKELEHTIMLSTDGMPENADLLENEFRRKISLFVEKIGIPLVFNRKEESVSLLPAIYEHNDFIQLYAAFNFMEYARSTNKACGMLDFCNASRPEIINDSCKNDPISRSNCSELCPFGFQNECKSDQRKSERT